MKRTFNFIIKNFTNLLALVIAIFSLTYVVLFETNSIHGASMNPTYSSGDIIISRKDNNNIERGDVVTLNGDSMTLDIGYENPNMIKRVIGLPGEEVKIVDNVLYVDGEPLDESYTNEQMKDAYDVIHQLAEDEYYVLGDNRNFSTDSRDFGPVKKDWIVGKAKHTVIHADK